MPPLGFRRKPRLNNRLLFPSSSDSNLPTAIVGRHLNSALVNTFLMYPPRPSRGCEEPGIAPNTGRPILGLATAPCLNSSASRHHSAMILFIMRGESKWVCSLARTSHLDSYPGALGAASLKRLVLAKHLGRDVGEIFRARDLVVCNGNPWA